ncbi:hypothetical protein HK404_19035 [Myxococcus xanthus]|nr:hypothetical protein [Myxococcus xanthus]
MLDRARNRLTWAVMMRVLAQAPRSDRILARHTGSQAPLGAPTSGSILSDAWRGADSMPGSSASL